MYHSVPPIKIHFLMLYSGILSRCLLLSSLSHVLTITGTFALPIITGDNRTNDNDISSNVPSTKVEVVPAFNDDDGTNDDMSYGSIFDANDVEDIDYGFLYSPMRNEENGEEANSKKRKQVTDDDLQKTNQRVKANDDLIEGTKYDPIDFFLTVIDNQVNQQDSIDRMQSSQHISFFEETKVKPVDDLALDGIESLASNNYWLQFARSRILDNPIITIRSTEYINMQDENRDTPLHIAVRRNDFPLIDVLLQLRVDPNVLNINGLTPLNIAISNEQLNAVILLIDGGAKMNLGNCEMLNYAIQYGSPVIVKELIKRGMAVNFWDRQQKTPLHVAVNLDSLDMVKVLLESGANPLAVDSFSKNPLFYARVKPIWDILNYAISLTQTEIANYKRDANANDLNAPKNLISSDIPVPVEFSERTDMASLGLIQKIESDHSKEETSDILNANQNYLRVDQPIHFAVRINHMGWLKSLILMGENLDAVSYDLSTPLMIAVQNNNSLMVYALIKAGANVNFIIPNRPQPLEIAIRNQKTEIVKLLLNSAANVHHRNSALQMPLHIAAQYQSHEIVLLLLQTGADPLIIDANGRSPLDYARNSPIIFNVLSNYFAAHSQLRHSPTQLIDKVRSTDTEQSTAFANHKVSKYVYGKRLCQAIQENNTAEFAALMIYNPSLKERCKKQTLLGLAIKNSNLIMVNLLIQGGANINLKSLDYTPLCIAVLEGNLEIVRFLLLKGADINALSLDQKPALFFALSMGRNHIALELMRQRADVSLLNKWPVLNHKISELQDKLIRFKPSDFA